MNTLEKLLDAKSKRIDGIGMYMPGFYNEFLCQEIDLLKEENRILKGRLEILEKQLNDGNIDEN